MKKFKINFLLFLICLFFFKAKCFAIKLETNILYNKKESELNEEFRSVKLSPKYIILEYDTLKYDIEF